MVTEAFSGARAPITYTGDHISGLFPNCHVVPRSTFELFAVGPYLDHNPNHAVVLTSGLALQLTNVNFKSIARAPDPRKALIDQLMTTDSEGQHLVSITTIGTRDGPGSLYHTNLFDPPPMLPSARAKLINSARTGNPFPNIKLPKLPHFTLPSPNNKQMQSPQPPPTTFPARQSTQSPSTTTKPSPQTPEWCTSTATERALLQLQELHCALGHPSNDALLSALAASTNKHHQRLRKYVKLMDKCNVCPAGSQRAESHPATATSRASQYLARVILDCSGRQPVASIGGAWYFLLITDDYSRRKWVRLLKTITQVAAIFDDFLCTIVRQGTANPAGKVRCVQLVRTDNGPDFNCDAFRQVLRKHSITHEPSPPDASQQRGLAERGIGVLSKIGRASLFWAMSPLPFWGEAIKHAAPTSDNTPNSANPNNASPFQMVNPDKPSQLSKLRPFGCLAFTLVKVKDRNGKLNPASSCGFFAGYGLTPDGVINGYRVMNFRTQRFTTKYNVRCNDRLPALRYVLSALVNSPQQMLVGRSISKKFQEGTFRGKITGHSTLENVTLYDILYDDGDKEQMDLVEVLRHINPIQDDMSIHRPNMHRRLQQSSKTDRAKIGKSLLPPHATPPATTHSTTTAQETCPLLPHRPKYRRKPPNRLTSTSLGSTVNSSALPMPMATHTANKANISTVRAKIESTRKATKDRRVRRHGRCTILPMITILANITSTQALPPNTVIDGISLHRFTTVSPPMPNVPPRDIPLPNDMDDAIHGPYKVYWRPAIQREIDSLFSYRVWRLEKVPPGALVLPCKMVFKVKPDGRDPPGIDKFKCRYCGKGFLQKKGKHYICAHAPVAAGMSTRIIVAIATELGWPLHGMDVSNAYLNADLDARIVLFVAPPATISVPRGYGLRLLKGLYGTMQGGNRWAVHKHKKLVQLGYARNPSEPCMYHRHDDHGFVIMSIVVDDFEITGWPPDAISYAKHQLSETWDMTDLGPLRFFTNVEIKRDRQNRVTTLKQTGYIESMLARYGLDDAYVKYTPCTASIYSQRLLDPVAPYPPTFENDYRSQVGTLGYLRRTRPDLCVALGVSAQFCKLGRHGPSHYRALRNIMRYCKLTRQHGLLYTSTYKRFYDPWDLSGHVDSDWAAWKGSRRSRSGWLIYLNANLIAFGSKLQSAVALSSAEAEYMALAQIIKIMLWILHIFEGMPGQFIKKPINVYVDNKPAINLADHHAASKFTRHISIAYHFLREHCADGTGLFNILWVEGKNQKADGMTKPLPRSSFILFKDTVVSDRVL